MEHCTKKPGSEKELPAFGHDSIEVAMRQRIRETIEAVVQQELDAVLGALLRNRFNRPFRFYRLVAGTTPP